MTKCFTENTPFWGKKFMKPLSAASVTQTLEILSPGCEYKDTFYCQGDCTGCSFFLLEY